MFKVSSCNLQWLETRIKNCHHNPLARYLTQRSPEQKTEAEAAGWTTNRIVEEAFFTTTVWTSVPKAMRRVLLKCDDLDSMVVWRKLQEMSSPQVSSGQEQFILESWSKFAKFLRYRRPLDVETIALVDKEILVWEVMIR